VDQPLTEFLCLNLFSRCSLLKACFTAVFPCLIKTGDSHLNDPKQKQILDKLLKIVQALLIQELKQSTLDEIFTLIEPYLKLPESISREMAVIILQTSLQTFLTNYNFQVRFKFGCKKPLQHSLYFCPNELCERIY
jgi:hypothetical protein